MVLAFIAGGLMHQWLHGLQWVLPYTIAVMLSITFTGLEVSLLKPERMHLRLMIALQCSWLFFWGLARLAGFPVLAESLYYCAAAPIAIAAPIIVNLLKGRVEFITTAVVISQIIFAIVTPLVLPFVVSEPDMPYGEFMLVVARQIAEVMLLPAGVAILLRKIWPESKFIARKLGDVSLGIWIINLTIISGIGMHKVLLMNYSWWDMIPLVIGALLVCITGFIAGYRLGYPAYKRECSQGLGQKNTILTLYIAGQPYASPLAYIGPAFYVFFHNIANAIQLSLAAREKSREKK